MSKAKPTKTRTPKLSRKSNKAQLPLLPTNGNGSNEAATSRAQLSSLIKSARDIMRKDAGLNGDLDRLPQLSWIIFLKCFDDLELRREAEAVMADENYKPVVPKRFRGEVMTPSRARLAGTARNSARAGLAESGASGCWAATRPWHDYFF
jgi:hypothetical protein